jgi:hypothetical protein
MATISIADNDVRVQYTQAVTAGTTQLTIDFPFFDNDDINVIVTSSTGVDTTLSRGTGTGTFAVVGTAVDDGFSGGYITLGDTYSNTATKFTIFRDIPVARTTDFPTSGPFNISSLNTELDKIFAIEQELETKLDRTMKLADSDTAASLTLPNVDTRKGTVLAFNATTGLPEAGPNISNLTTIAAISADIGTLADIEDGTVATDAISDLAAIASDVTSVHSIKANVTTVATNINDIGTVVTNITDIQNAEEHAQEAKDYATKTNGEVQENGANTGNYSSKAWAVGGTGVTDASGGGAAKEWAVDQSADGVDGTEYSAKEYAIGSTAGNTNGSAKQWALGGGSSYSTNTTVDGTNYSARYWAEQAASYVDTFDDIYLGAKSSDPTVDNDGDPLNAGDLYYSTTDQRLKVYNTSVSPAQWEDAVVDTTGFATNGFAIAMAIAL